MVVVTSWKMLPRGRKKHSESQAFWETSNSGISVQTSHVQAWLQVESCVPEPHAQRSWINWLRLGPVTLSIFRICLLNTLNTTHIIYLAKRLLVLPLLLPVSIPHSHVFPWKCTCLSVILGGKFHIPHVSTVCFLLASKWFLLDLCWNLCYSKIGLTSDRTGDIIKNPTWTISLAAQQPWKQYEDQSEYASVLTHGSVFLGEECTEKKSAFI